MTEQSVQTLKAARALQMHMAPEVEEHGAMQRLDRPLQEQGRRDHAVVDGLLEPFI